jgi:hypothetical protein
MKWKGKVYSDKKRDTKESDIKEGDTVLSQQPKMNKLSTSFHPTPNKVIKKNGSAITYQTPEGAQYTRNASFLKRFHAPDITRGDRYQDGIAPRREGPSEDGEAALPEDTEDAETKLLPSAPPEREKRLPSPRPQRERRKPAKFN